MFILLSYVIANTQTPILDMMSYSWGILSGSFLAPYAIALYWKGINRTGAWAGCWAALHSASAGGMQAGFPSGGPAGAGENCGLRAAFCLPRHGGVLPALLGGERLGQKGGRPGRGGKPGLL